MSRKYQKIRNQLLSLFLAVAMLAGNVYTVSAEVYVPGNEEATVEPTSAADPTPTVESTPAPEPTPTAEAAPTPEPTPTAESTPTAEPTPTSEAAPTSEPTPTPENSAPVITALTGAPESLAVDYGTLEEELSLPSTLTAVYDNGTTAPVNVTWVYVSDGSGGTAYDPEPEDPTKVYLFAPVLSEGTPCAAGLTLPQVPVSFVLPMMTLAEPATATITNSRGKLSYTVDGLPAGVTVASQQWMKGDTVVGTENTHVLTMDDMKAGATISLSLKDSDGNVLCTDDYDIGKE